MVPASIAVNKRGFPKMDCKVFLTGIVSATLTVAFASPAAASQWHDATSGEFLDVGRPISDVNATTWAYAGSAAHEVCGLRGFVGGFLDGHQSGTRKGIICVPADDGQWFDATNGQLLDTGWPIADTNTASW